MHNYNVISIRHQYDYWLVYVEYAAHYNGIEIVHIAFQVSTGDQHNPKWDKIIYAIDPQNKTCRR